MSLIVVSICAALLPMRLRVANGSSYEQPCTQNCFVFCGFSRFEEVVLLIIFIALTYFFLAFIVLGAVVLELEVILHK